MSYDDKFHALSAAEQHRLIEDAIRQISRAQAAIADFETRTASLGRYIFWLNVLYSLLGLVTGLILGWMGRTLF